MREVEHHMDVEMFLEGQARWELDSPHCPIILHEMFQHATEQGQKEVEYMICQRGWEDILPRNSSGGVRELSHLESLDA